MVITANQVTLARIMLLPLPVFLLIYGNETSWWIAFFLAVFLGTTDFIDGLMARREGPTRLGSLIDPVADKIFVAAFFISFSALKIFSPWIISLLLVREFLLTSLRSSVAIRQEVMKTSVLGKLKTIIQMGGLGSLFFTLMLNGFYNGIVCLILSFAFLLIALAHFIKKKKQTYWALPVSLAFLLVSFLGFFSTINVNIAVQILIIVSLTWISAFDYLLGTYRLFRRTGIKIGDLLRLLWSLIYGLLIAPLGYYFPEIVLPLLGIIALEFLLGGIDNIVIAETMSFNNKPFIASIIYGLSLAILVKLSPLFFTIVVMLLSLIVCSLFFLRHKTLFKRSLRGA